MKQASFIDWSIFGNVFKYIKKHTYALQMGWSRSMMIYCRPYPAAPPEIKIFLLKY